MCTYSAPIGSLLKSFMARPTKPDQALGVRPKPLKRLGPCG